MVTEFIFYDYVAADGDGANIIKTWLNRDGKIAKAYFTNMIGQLEVSPPHGKIDSVWKMPYVRDMDGRWAGFIELRKEVKNVQYRLIAQMRGRSVFLVACGIHKDQNFTTDVSPQTASNRVIQMIDNPGKYRREHEYN